MKGKKKGRLAAAILASVMTLTLLFQAALPASAEGVEDLSTAVATESDLPENTVEGGTESTSQEMSSEDVENEAVGTSEDETATTSEEDAEIQPSSEGSSEENASETQEDSTVLSDDGDNSSETEEQESDVANAEDSEEEMTISEEAVVEGTQEEEISDTDEEGEEYNSEPITGSESSGGVTVYVNAPEGSFPEGTTLSIEPINQSEAETLVSDTDVTAAVAFDITFYDANGDRVQPQNGKTVEVTFSINGSSDLAVSDGEEGELQVIHVGDEGNEQLGSTVAPENGSGTEIRVDADSFSPYAVVLKAQRRAPAATPREVPATITNFTIQNLSGQDVEKVYFTDKFYLAMDWDASSSGADLHEGDYFDITLPSEMRFPSDSASVDFNIYGDDGTTVIATAHVSPGANNTGGTVRVTFTNWVEGKENIKGNIHLAATFDRQQIQNDQDNTFSITVNGQVTPVAVHVTGPQGLKPEVIGKWGQTASSGAKDEAEWYVRINHQKATLTNVVISDHLSAGAGNETYIPGSFILARVEMDAYGDIKQTYESDNSADLSGRLTISTDRKSFSINLGDLNGDQYRLRYSTTYTPGTRLRNNVTLTSTQQTKTTSASHISADSGGSGTGNLANKIKLTKVDADNNSTVLAGAVFEVTRPDGSTFELTTGADGTVTSGSLTSGTYRVKEKVAPVGYELNEEEFELQVTPDGGAVKTITDKKLQINISITKKWEDADNQDGIRPSAEDFASKVKLMNGTEEVTGYPPTVTDNGDGTYTVKYSDLPEYVNGSKADYKIAEDSIDGYTADKTSAADGETITNSHTPGTTEISITKKWADTNNQDGIRPSANEYAAKVHLMNGDTEVENVVPTVTDNGDGTYTVTYSNLPKNSNGTAINYTVKEDTVDGYEADQSTVSNGQTMTNTHTPETTSVSGTKTWEDNNDQDGARPESITIRLLANGEEVQSKEVTAEDNWSWTFSELPKYKDGAEIAYSVKEDAVTDYSASYEGANVTNTHTPGKTSVSVTKAWDDSNNQDGKRPNSVTVHLYADDVDTGKTVTLSEANNWSDSFTDLDEKKNGQKINYTVKEDAVAGYTSVTSGDAATGYTVTNSYTPETTNIHGAKTWDDNNNQDGARPESITIRLSDGTTEQVKTVTEADNWEWSFNDLPKYKDGNEITYTITEDAVTDYSAVVNGYDVTNTHTPGKTSVSVTKTWNDSNNQDGKRPNSVTVHLYADDVDTGKTVTLSEANNWSDSFTDLDEYKNGVKINYTVKEDAVAGYTSVTSGDAAAGYTVTNTHTPETTNIHGAKTWDDNNNQDGARPESITIRLSDGTTEQVKTVTEADNWEWSFNDLPKYKDGNEITYTITEDAVTDYSAVVNGYDVTNTHTPGKTSVSVTKTWNDSNNQDGKRPNSVTVHLYADDVDTGKTITLSDANHWSDSFTDLDEKKNGQKINYTVKEDEVTGYTSVTSGDAPTGYTVTNTHTPETVAVSGSKTWDDNNDQDGARPESITIRLLANGEEVQSKEVTASDNWSWTFSDLPKYKDGAEIAYSVKEDAVADYSASYEGANVTNTHTPGKTSISVSKAWEDSNNQDGKRPDKVVIHLLADGTDTGRTLELMADNQWTGSFTDLDEYASGKKIVYTVSEDGVNDYEATISGDAAAGYTVTNTHTPETVAVSGSKTWDDNNNQDGARPEKITIRLLADGTEVTSKEVTTADSWKWSFDNLAKYDNGKEIVYTITEDAVEDYTSKVNGYDVTNTHIPGKTSLYVTKAWEDSNNQDGKRPDSVAIHLLADGEDTGKTVTLNEANGWTASFEGLDAKKAGKDIAYTVKEDAAAGYDVTITGDAKTGYTVTNTYTPQTTSVSGAKTWEDNNNQDGIRPASIMIRLLADGKEVQRKEVTASDNWSWTFSDLPKYKDGAEITYSVKEDAVANYSTGYEGANVTNTYTPGKTSVSVSKTWNDNGNQDGKRPDKVVIHLLADGTDTGRTLELTENNRWTGSFTDLDEYANGQKITYTVSEEPVENYSTAISGTAMTGYTITNTITGKVSIPVTKVWSGGTGDKAVVHLFADGREIAKQELNPSNNWQHTFENLDKFKDGKEISYTLTEDGVSGYSTSITYSQEKGFTVTNAKTPDKPHEGGEGGPGSVSLYKVDAQTGEYLAGAEFALYRSDGVYIGTYTTDSHGYLNVQNLPYSSYYFKETKAPENYVANPGYIRFVLDAAHSAGNAYPWNIKVTNTKPGVPIVVIGGTKTWDDNNNAKGIRPETITLHLLANGIEIANTQTSAEQNWNYNFGTQPLYDAAGKAISYTVTEDAVAGYIFSLDDPVAGNGNIVINVKNTLAPEKPADNNKSEKLTGSNPKTERPTVTRNAATGDDSNMMLYLILMIGGITALVAYLIFMKKRQRKTE